jgi:hypothetical protein
VVAKGRGEFVRVLFGDVGDGAEKKGEADREHTFFAAWEDAATEVESGKCGIGGGSAPEIVGNEVNFLGLLRSTGNGIAELAEAEHGRGRKYRMERLQRRAGRKIGLAESCGFAENCAIETIQRPQHGWGDCLAQGCGTAAVPNDCW